MGTVRYRADRGAHQIDFVDATGRRVRQLINGGERLARRILEQREAEAVLGVHRIAPAQTPRFGDFADDWLRRGRARGLKPKTLESYEGTVNVHLRPRFGESRLGTISRRDVEDFVTALAETGTRRGKKKRRVPLSPTTVNYALHVLKFILKDAVDQGHLTESPAALVRPLRAPDRVDGERLQILRPDEIGRLLDIAQKPFRSLYQLAIYSGMRRGELLALHWSQVDLRNARVHVRRTRGRVKDGDVYRVVEGPLKTAASRRVIDVPRPVLLDLPGSDVEDDYVFRNRDGAPLDPDNVDRTFTRHLTLAGVPMVRFHDLRHTHASLLIAANVHPKAIQARLGHTSITTTLNTYGHLMPSAFQGVGEQLDRLLSGTKNGTRTAPDATGEQVDARKP
ncbi:MAG TPA: site-specific integrase [bacterium]|nr:site-specific integrase [bacterium]